MRILLIHNYYREPGGEDVVFNEEGSLLREYGHSVFDYVDTNKRIETYLDAASHIWWSTESYGNIISYLRRIKPDIVHVHNTFFVISPSVYYACWAEGVPVVQSLHNYRLICPVGIFYRDGHVCEECVGKKIPYPGVVHGCYHQSGPQTFGIASMLSLHRLLGTWEKKIFSYIALTEFGKRKFVEGGIPEHKITVKPNFLKLDPGIDNDHGNYALFAGRLSQDKGIYTLINAWKLIQDQIPIKIAGTDPLKGFIAKNAGNIPGMEYLGNIERQSLLTLMKHAYFLIVPSEWYEGFSLVVIEAFACGLPVIASNHGALSELIKNEVTGLLFSPGDSKDLSDKVFWARDHPKEMAAMGRNARLEYEAKYTAERNYEMIMSIYKQAALAGSQNKDPFG